MSCENVKGEGNSSSEERHNKVHSANNWEQVDLGDDDRKKKFLRLMGASKKEHHGKIVIGDHEANIHGRTKDETKHLDENLEEQFKQGLEHKFASGFKGHVGLGFHKDEEKKEEALEKEQSTNQEEDSSNGKEEKRSSDVSPDGNTEQSKEDIRSLEKGSTDPSSHKHRLEEQNGDNPGKKKIKMMNFVKAST